MLRLADLLLTLSQGEWTPGFGSLSGRHVT